jgi:hypothetical protein
MASAAQRGTATHELGVRCLVVASRALAATWQHTPVDRLCRRRLPTGATIIAQSPCHRSYSCLKFW